MIVDTQAFDPAKLGRKLTIEEARRRQLDMLDALADFCDAHGLTYYLSGGTLLGAVRHRGYIPWDDDIDVNMPRPDVEKLIRLTGGRLGGHLVIARAEGPIEHATSFPRLLDTRYVLKTSTPDGRASYFTNLFIDIFPIEGLPTDFGKVRRHYLLTRSMITMRHLAYYTGPLTGRRGPMKALRYALRPVAKLFGYRFWNRMLLKLAKKYDYDRCDYVGVVCGYVHTTQEYIKKEGYGVPVKIPFENRMYNAPADADTYLKNLYGDYMQLPPPEKRAVHHFDIWERKED